MCDMAKQTRMVFAPGDMVQMRLRCGSCGGDSAYPVTRTFDVPCNCPHCNEEWWDNRPGIQLTDAEVNAIGLARAIHYFLNPRNSIDLAKVRFGIQLEIDGEPPSETP